MKRNKIIQATLAISKFSFWFFIVLLTAFVFAIVHSIISPEFYSDFQILNDGNTLSFNFDYCSECERASNSISLSEVSGLIKAWMLLHFSALLIFLILIQHEGIKIWKSVKDYKTFYNQNKLHFRQIAKYTFAIFIIGIFNFIDEGQRGIGLEVGFPVVWIALSLVSLGLSEIFKEGQLLQEDKDSIV
ncbi:hypothetical protein SYJ56_14035 [Algoriphagus sp. D3-2-R+10]|uniref:hypothetical protein n=1 Tax=Algoriphagus aurantiacus TaxID=3103948 RepID=UPI002B3658EF|nr:hypothetical protein [Algoriphagus sp. D3-2-R+10]MEB2776438.1 hypothetical protein [Algoriphagus sp. D3-2-R+10]